LLPSVARAERPGKGHSLVHVALSGHRGQFVFVIQPILGFPGAVGAFERSEVGGEFGYSRFLSDEWTLGISGAYHASRERSEQSGYTLTDDSHSFTARVGADRYAFIDDNVALCAGPGATFTRGRSKVDDSFITDEDPDATEIGLDGRIGMYARLGKGWAFIGHVGQVLSRTSGKASFGKISWWSSTPEGALGLAFDF